MNVIGEILTGLVFVDFKSMGCLNAYWEKEQQYKQKGCCTLTYM
jgi:hypothetical protein